MKLHKLHKSDYPIDLDALNNMSKIQNGISPGKKVIAIRKKIGRHFFSDYFGPLEDQKRHFMKHSKLT